MSNFADSITGRVSGGENLALDEMSSVIDSMMSGEWSDDRIALFLNALRLKGETVEEVAGAAAAMRQHMTPIRSTREGVLDTCGTGGDGSGTFNISTAAALVTAAAGVPVAKHGNRSITSKTGSADVLAELGVNIDADVEVVARCLDEVGICFCFARDCIRRCGTWPPRAAAWEPLTIFNMLGPLCNPASAPFQLLGVGKARLRELLSSALALLGSRRAVVVCGEDGLDEVSLAAATNVTEVTPRGVRQLRWTSTDFGLTPGDHATLRVENPAESAAMIRDVLAGQSGAARDIVVLNAAAALWTAGRDDDLSRCAARAAEAIDSGAASQLLERLAKASRG